MIVQAVAPFMEVWPIWAPVSEDPTASRTIACGTCSRKRSLSDEFMAGAPLTRGRD